MFVINDDMTIYATRGDTGVFNVMAKLDDTDYTFRKDDVVRFKVFEKKKCDRVVLQKDVKVTEETTTVQITVEDSETKIGDIINKPVDYWYEIELNPEKNAQTILGYDEDGPKIFRLFPEGGEIYE
ncbi:MAG: hypothetical protein IJZ54_08965 [Clostridia bacterium]|nr:hypothetical protein [Clostridia bacterium]